MRNGCAPFATSALAVLAIATRSQMRKLLINAS